MYDINDDQHEHERNDVSRERGASMVEYALLLALIALAAIVAVTAFGGGLGTEFSGIGSTVNQNLDAR